MAELQAGSQLLPPSKHTHIETHAPGPGDAASFTRSGGRVRIVAAGAVRIVDRTQLWGRGRRRRCGRPPFERAVEPPTS